MIFVFRSYGTKGRQHFYDLSYMADSVLMMEAEAAFKHLKLPPFIHLH